jgi:tetratricopeptide (TPR) repeat protein
VLGLFLAGCAAFSLHDSHQCRSLARTSPDLALAHCTRAIQSVTLTEREAAALLVDRGNAWLAKKDYDAAIADYAQAIRSGRLSAKNLSAAHNNRGGAWDEKKDHDRAIADYTEAIRLDAASAAAYSNRGGARARKKNYEGAIADYDQTIRLDPFDSVAHNNRGDAWYDKKDYDRAISDYTEAIRLAPRAAGAYNDRAAAFVEKREYARGLADYEKAAGIDPTLARHYSLGVTYFYLGRLAQSAEALERAVSASPRDSYAVLWRYLVRARAGARDAARELGESASAVTGRSWPAPVIDFYLGRSDERALFTAAGDTNPSRAAELARPADP